MKIIKTTCYKGTVIRVGDEKRQLIDGMIRYLYSLGFSEIWMPAIQYQQTFKNKVGSENNNLMFNFQDRKERDICLAPEYTAICQQLAQTDYKNQKDVKLFYIAECFRGERQQRGRWRQFTQLGVEALNLSADYHPIYLSTIAEKLVNSYLDDSCIEFGTTRGLDYYKPDSGFEITKDGMQLCGGGEYEGGVGFAIGIDRMLLLKDTI